MNKLILSLIIVICLSSFASASVTDSISSPPNSQEATHTEPHGMTIRALGNYIVDYATVSALTDATVCRIYDTNGTLISASTRAVNTCTFGNVTLVQNREYHLVISSNGASYTFAYFNPFSGYPETDTNIIWINKCQYIGYWHNNTASTANFVSITTSDVVLPDATSPSFSLITNNGSRYYNDVVNYSAVITEANPDFYAFAWNITGIFVNETFAEYTNGQNVSILKTINITKGNVCMQLWANDTSGNSNTSLLDCFDIIDNLAPVCTLISRTPSDINDSSTGILQEIFNCTDTSGINVSKTGVHYPFFITRTVDAFILAAGVPNYWSNRYPANNISSIGTLTPPYQIWRALGRNRGFWYDSLTGLSSCAGLSPCYQPLNDSFSYAIEDGNYGHINVTNTSNYVIINYTHPAVDIAAFRQSVYLSYEGMTNENKKNQSISNQNPALIKRFDAEAYRGTKNYTMNVYRNILYGTPTPSSPLNGFYCNSSYNPSAGIKVINSPNCVLVNSITPTMLNTIIFTDRNSSYSKGTYSVTNGKFGGIGVTSEFYFEYETLQGVGAEYKMKYVNGTPLDNMNTTFKNTNVAWTSTNAGATWTQAQWTPDVFTTMVRSANDEYQSGLGHVCDMVGNCFTNTTIVTDTITLTNHPITNPTILYYNNTVFDVDLNATHSGILTIRVGVAKDPDNVSAVTHNLTLRNPDGSWNYTINSSFLAPDDAPIYIYFNTSLVPDAKYKMNITATALDNPLDIESFLTYNNFTIYNNPPIVSNLVWRTVGGITSGALSYGQTIDEINATCTDGSNDMFGCNITVTDPDGTIRVNNVKMSNTGSNYNYSTDISLDKTGSWVISVTGDDILGSTTASTTITVGITNPTIFDGLYAYDYQRLLTTTEIDTELATYDYDTIGMTLNWSNFNTTFGTFKTVVNYTKEIYSVKTFLTINFDTGNYNRSNSFTNETCSQINNNLTSLKVAPYDEAIQYILFDVNLSDTSVVNFSNKIAECIVNATANKFAVYVNYSSASLNSNWVNAYTLINVTATDNSTYINKELDVMRTSTSLTRIYFSLTAALQNVAELFHDTIITKIRGTPVVTSLSNETLAEISNGDIIVFNNESASTSLIYNVSGGTRAGKDVWDSTNKRFIEKDNDGLINVNISAYSFLNLYFADIDHLTLSTVRASSTAANQVYGWNRTVETQGSFSIVGANDAMFYAYDPTYGQSRQFFAHYEWINTSFVTNYTDYCNNGVVIIADYSELGINQTIGCNNQTFGYVSVADYADTDAWVTTKTAEIDVWIDTYQINVFLDGLDYAVAGTNFATRFTTLINHIQVQKGKKVITNDYTSYNMVGVGGLGDYDMKESFCGRWSGAVGSPVYTYEYNDVDYARAVWARTNGNLQLLMTFGDRLDTSKMAYCYAKYLVWYGDGGLYRYGQPNFQGQQEIYTLDAGDQLENTWTEVNTTYHYRKYSNGKVWVNPLDNQSWGIEDNRAMNNLSFCIKAQIYASTPAQSTPIALDVNGNSVSAITYDEIGAVQWSTNWVCRDITSLYNITGKYAIRMSSQTPANPAGLNIYNSLANRTGVYSFYDATTYNPPPDDGKNWTAYGRSGNTLDTTTTNWYINLISNSTTSAEIDNGITDITQSNQSYQRRTNLTISSTKSYDIEVWGEPITVHSYVNLSYWNGTVYKGMNPLNTTTCDSLNPEWASTTIDGQAHKSCIESSGTDTIVRIAAPSLSSRTYSILGDDIYLPWFTNNQTNQTATTPEFLGTVQLNITINDDSGIDYYRLTTLNDYGYPSNESARSGAGQTSIIVVWNYTIIGVKNGTLQYQFWANDTAGNNNVSEVYSIEVHDIIAPAYFNFTNNASTKAKYGGVVNFSINITDYNYGAGTGYFEFANNKTGVMRNVSITDADFVYESLNVYGYSTIASYGLEVNLTRGNNICGQFWMKDYAGNVNQTLLTDSGTCFTVANSPPTQPTISYPVNNSEYTSVTQIKFTSTDIDNDAITYYVFINNTLNSTTTTNLSSWNASDGYYKLDVIASDSYDNSTNSTTYFKITPTPVVTPESSSSSGDSNTVIPPSVQSQTALEETKKQEQNISLFSRIISKEKVLNNGICDDGEWAIIDKDCNFSINKIQNLSILKEAWVIRLLLLITIVMIFRKKGDILVMTALTAGVLIYNGLFNVSSFINKGIVSSTINCSGAGFFQNFGDCVWPSQPIIGWLILSGIIAMVLASLPPPKSKRK